MPISAWLNSTSWRSPPDNSPIERRASSRAPTSSSAQSISRRVALSSVTKPKRAPIADAATTSQPVSLEARDRAAILRHVADQGVAARRRLAEHRDRARSQRNEAERGAHERRLAGAVRAQHADEFAFLDLEAGGREDIPAAELDRHMVES